MASFPPTPSQALSKRNGAAIVLETVCADNLDVLTVQSLHLTTDADTSADVRKALERPRLVS